MSKALAGIKILDFTHVPSGPTCTQVLAWFGADVIKVERPGAGAIARTHLQDIPDVDSLYFTMLNHDKRSIIIDVKKLKGLEVLERLIGICDVMVEDFAPGVLDRMGLSWAHIQQINSEIIVASVKEVGPAPCENRTVCENAAPCAGGSATPGFRDGLPLMSGDRIGDSGPELPLAQGIMTALSQRARSGRGQRRSIVLNAASTSPLETQSSARTAPL